MVTVGIEQRSNKCDHLICLHNLAEILLFFNGKFLLILTVFIFFKFKLKIHNLGYDD